MSAERMRRALREDLQNADAEVRRLAVERIADLEHPEALEALLERLGDPSWRVRKAVVARLVALPPGADGIAGLLDALGNAENSGCRNAAVEALIGCGEIAVPDLEARLGCEDVDVRKLVIDSLAGIGSASACQALLAALSDADPNVRAAAADALRDQRGNAVETRLVAAATGDPERLVRLSALRSLHRHGTLLRTDQLGEALDDRTLSPAAYAVLGRVDDPAAVPVLQKALASRSRMAREAAMGALLRWLGQQDGDAAHQGLREIREAARISTALVPDAGRRLLQADLETRLMLVQFLGLVGSPHSVVPMLAASGDPALAGTARAALAEQGEATEVEIDASWSRLDADQRCLACGVLGDTRGEVGARRLRACLASDDSRVRAAAASGLALRGDRGPLREMLGALEAAACDADCEAEDECASIVEALVVLDGAPELESGAGVAALLAERLVAGVPEPVRCLIARVLARVARSEDAAFVVALARDASAEVRRLTVAALARLDPDAASEPLRLALADEAPAVRVAAAAALGRAPQVERDADLQRLLQDADPRVQASAARALGLRGAAADASEPVRERWVGDLAELIAGSAAVAIAAVEALEAIGGGAAVAAARRGLEREEPELVLAAVRCIGSHADLAGVEVLIAQVAHPEWSVRAEVLDVLARRGVAKAIPAILRRLELERDAFVREAMMRALARLGA